MSTSEIVATATREGMKVQAGYVSEVRSGGLINAESELRRLAIRLGVLRAETLVREVTEQLEQLASEAPTIAAELSRIEARIGTLAGALVRRPASVDALWPELTRLREQRRDLLVRTALDPSTTTMAEVVSVDISTPDPTLEELLGEHDSPADREFIPPSRELPPPSSETRFAVAIPRERGAFEMSDAHRATVREVVEGIGEVRPLQDAIEAAPLLETLDDLTSPDHQAAWLLLPTDVQRAVVRLLVAVAREIQDTPGVSLVLGTRLESVFRRLTAFSRDHRPGYVHGLSRGHLPKIGTWVDDITFSREELLTWLR